MRAPLYDQATGAPGVPADVNPDEDRTRQEFKADADVNVIVRRFGPNAFAGGEYGSQDFDLDLLQVQEATRTALKGFSRLPEAVQARYRDVESYLAAFATGDLALVDDEVVVAVEPAPAGSTDAATGQGEAAAAKGESVT